MSGTEKKKLVAVSRKQSSICKAHPYHYLLTIGSVLEEIARSNIQQGNVELPNRITMTVGDQIECKQSDLRCIITPGQVQRSRVVLFPMTEIECHINGPEYEEHVHGTLRVVESSKNRINTERNEERSPTIHPVIHQLAQRPR